MTLGDIFWANGEEGDKKQKKRVRRLALEGFLVSCQVLYLSLQWESSNKECRLSIKQGTKDFIRSF